MSGARFPERPRGKVDTRLGVVVSLRSRVEYEEDIWTVLDVGGQHGWGSRRLLDSQP